jgi:selenoprotein W-related protein
LTAKLLTEFKQKIGEFTLIPAGGGCFELTIDGDLVYSKLKTGTFPDEGDMAKAVSHRLKKPVA